MTGDAVNEINRGEEMFSTIDIPIKGQRDMLQKKNVNEFNQSDQNKNLLWKVSTIPTIGKVLVATRDIRPWENVLEDTALITTPT